MFPRGSKTIVLGCLKLPAIFVARQLFARVYWYLAEDTPEQLVGNGVAAGLDCAKAVGEPQISPNITVPLGPPTSAHHGDETCSDV